MNLREQIENYLPFNEQEELSYKEDESQGVKWISFNDATDKSIVDFIRSTHQKLIDKIKTTL